MLSRTTIDRQAEGEGYSHSLQLCHNRYLDMLKQDFNAKFDMPVAYERSAEDFDFIQTLGAGAFGTVFLARDRINFTYHAVKSIDKEVVIKKKTIKNLFLEKKILQSISFPFLISMDYTCKDNCYVYFMLPFEIGGELYRLLKQKSTFTEDLVQFYASQMVLALEYLHHCNVVHRDVKPENILINESGYIKLGDFGFSKILKHRAWTLCGTPEYIAPEIILSRGYSYSVDWWAFGVLVYEMSAGYPPFYSTDPIQLYEKILAGQFKTPASITRNCRSLIKRLLEVDPSKRFGSLKSGVYDIKSHKWFQEINWHDILQQKTEPPFVPICKEKGDTVNFRENDDTKLKRSPECLYEEEFKMF